jgi:Tfp pilus assembly protein PilF
LAEAARGYERLLRARPGDARALALLGALRLQQGEARPAAKLLRQALALAPGDAAARYNLGLALLRLGEDADAEAAFRGVLAAQPGHGGALVNLGGLLNRQGGFVEAEALLRRALGARFDAALGVRFDAALGARFDAALGARFDAALGARFDAALGVRLEPGLGAQPGDALALNNLGACLHGQGRHAEAISPLRQALALRPDYALALENLGAALLAADQPAAAAQALDQAVALNAVPSGDLLGAALLARLRLHRWDGAAALLARALAAPAPPPEPLDLLYHPLPPATLRAQAAAQAAEVVARVAALPRPRRASRPPGRIRLGYVSGDLHEHATAWLVAETLERHDRAAFQVHAYATSPDDGGPMRRRLAWGVEVFRDVSDLGAAAPT